MTVKNAVLIFNGTNQHSFSAKADCLVTLNPGKNVVSVAKLENLTKGDAKSDVFIDMLDSGEIKIVDESAVEKAETSEAENTTGTKNPNDDDIVIDVTKLGAREAVLLIKSEADVDVVLSYLVAEEGQGNDQRPSVVKAATESIAALEAPAKDED